MPDLLMNCVPAGLDPEALAELRRLKPAQLAKGSVLFRPGEEPPGFLLVAEGRVGVYLVGRGGREILLYSVAPGETCVQTTLGLLGGQSYAGEAVAESDVTGFLVPRGVFQRLMESSSGFRRFVFQALGVRLNDVLRVLELVAFVKVEARLIDLLVERADADGVVTATHHDLATAIGSAREVVSRRLEALAQKGLIELDRGAVRLVDRPGLARLRRLS
jgi:CRP/FNR family transcriptional regulator